MSVSGVHRFRERYEANSKGHLERRALGDASGMAVHEAGDEFIVEGYASTFPTPENPSYRVGSFNECVARSAFDRTLSSLPDVVFTCDHGQSLSGLPLARTRSSKGGPGTLTLWTDNVGLAFRAQLDREDHDAKQLMRAIKTGRIWQASMAFRVEADVFDEKRNLRTLKTIGLHGGDVAAVGFPANDATTVSARAAHAADLERRRDLSADISRLNRRDRERLAALGVVLRTDRPRIDVRSNSALLPSQDERNERIIDAERRRLERMRVGR